MANKFIIRAKEPLLCSSHWKAPKVQARHPISRLSWIISRPRDISYFSTREPGGTSIGEQIREVIHDLKNQEMHPRTETLLYQAARAQIVEQVIKPRLAAGEVVISDRYYNSTIAYQGYGHQQDLEQVRALVRYATGGLVPDLTILLDLDVEMGLEERKRITSGTGWMPTPSNSTSACEPAI